jgi:hypothetical protein
MLRFCLYDSRAILMSGHGNVQLPDSSEACHDLEFSQYGDKADILCEGRIDLRQATGWQQAHNHCRFPTIRRKPTPPRSFCGIFRGTPAFLEIQRDPAWNLAVFSFSQAILVQVKMARGNARLFHLRGTIIRHLYIYLLPHSHVHSTMSSRLALSSSSPLPTLSPDIPSDESLEPSEASSHQGKSWIDPATLPQYHHPSYIGGNVADYVKRLNYNTLMFYGVGEKGSFGYEVGKSLRFTDVSLQRDVDKHGRLQATTTAELQVTKREYLGRRIFHYVRVRS